MTGPDDAGARRAVFGLARLEIERERVRLKRAIRADVLFAGKIDRAKIARLIQLRDELRALEIVEHELHEIGEWVEP